MSKSCSTTKQIVIFRFGQLGDTIAAMPALQAIRHQFPEHRIILLSETPSATHLPPAEILGGSGLVDSFITYKFEYNFRSFFSLLKTLHNLARKNVSSLIYLVPSTRTWLKRFRDLSIFRLCGFRNILGIKGFPINPYPRSLDGQLLSVPPESEALLGRLRLSGIEGPEDNHLGVDLFLTEDEKFTASAWLEQHGLGAGGTTGWFAVCPGSKWPSKRWPLGNYELIGQRLITELGLVPVVVGGKEDIAAGETLISQWGAGFNAAGKFKVRVSASLLEQARFYLGNDTGVMHVAAAVGIPCVAVFSAQDWPDRWNPLPIRGQTHRIFRSHVPCAGCRSMNCSKDLRCLTQVDPQKVFEACVDVAERRPD